MIRRSAAPSRDRIHLTESTVTRRTAPKRLATAIDFEVGRASARAVSFVRWSRSDRSAAPRSPRLLPRAREGQAGRHHRSAAAARRTPSTSALVRCSLIVASSWRGSPVGGVSGAEWSRACFRRAWPAYVAMSSTTQSRPARIRTRLERRQPTTGVPTPETNTFQAPTSCRVGPPPPCATSGIRRRSSLAPSAIRSVDAAQSRSRAGSRRPAAGMCTRRRPPSRRSPRLGGRHGHPHPCGSTVGAARRTGRRRRVA